VIHRHSKVCKGRDSENLVNIAAFIKVDQNKIEVPQGIIEYHGKAFEAEAYRTNTEISSWKTCQ
jgi:hypothetical protein